MSLSDLYSKLYYIYTFFRLKHTILHFNRTTYACIDVQTVTAALHGQAAIVMQGLADVGGMGSQPICLTSTHEKTLFTPVKLSLMHFTHDRQLPINPLCAKTLKLTTVLCHMVSQHVHVAGGCRCLTQQPFSCSN